MVQIYISWPLALILGAIGGYMIYKDAKDRGMETADIWAVAFFGGMFIPPILGSIIVTGIYLYKRNPRKPKQTKVPSN